MSLFSVHHDWRTISAWWWDFDLFFRIFFLTHLKSLIWFTHISVSVITKYLNCHTRFIVSLCAQIFTLGIFHSTPNLILQIKDYHSFISNNQKMNKLNYIYFSYLRLNLNMRCFNPGKTIDSTTQYHGAKSSIESHLISYQ